MTNRPNAAPTPHPNATEGDDAVWRADAERVVGPGPEETPAPYGGDQGTVTAADPEETDDER